MKFVVQMKDPDTLQDAIADAVKRLTIEGLDATEMQMVREHREEEINKICGKWWEFGEYLRVEVDTDLGTCTVLEK